MAKRMGNGSEGEMAHTLVGLLKLRLRHCEYGYFGVWIRVRETEECIEECARKEADKGKKGTYI